MGVVVVLLVVVGLLLAQLWEPSPRAAGVGATKPEPARAPVPGADHDTLIVQTGLFTEEFLRERMRSLAAELERLDRDRDVFAKAFHTIAARTAYDALVVDASTVSTRTRYRVGEVLDADQLSWDDDPGEVLEI